MTRILAVILGRLAYWLTHLNCFDAMALNLKGKEGVNTFTIYYKKEILANRLVYSLLKIPG